MEGNALKLIVGGVLIVAGLMMYFYLKIRLKALKEKQQNR